MKDKDYANSLRRSANAHEASAANWLKFAKNTNYCKGHRIVAARRYRDNMRLAKNYREMAKKYE